MITEQTLAIIQDNQGYFITRMIQGTGSEVSEFTAKEILEFNCHAYGSSFEGRLDFSRKILGMKSKLPVSVFPEQGIFMFPTTSPTKESCIWFSYYQIIDYKRSGTVTRVYFMNGHIKIVNISYYQFDLQIKRTSHVIAQYNSPFLNQH